MSKKLHRCSTVAQSSNPSALIPPITPNSLAAQDQSSTFLHEDIIATEILPRLRIKSLFTFKCVSIQYESIISDPEFAHNYLQKAYSSPESSLSSGLKASLLYPFTDISQYRDSFSENVKDLTSNNDDQDQDQDQDQLSVNISYLPLQYAMGYKIVGSSNGLILSCLYTGFRKRTYFFLVTNPLTKKFAMLPISRASKSSQEGNAGIATRRDEVEALLRYKVVFIHTNLQGVNPDEYTKTTVEIFSSDTGRWTAFRVSGPGEITSRTTLKTGFSYKGIFYWLDTSMGSIITYDPFDSPDRFGHIPLPNGSHANSSLVYSGEKEMLRYCETHFCKVGLDRLSIWRLVDHEKGEWCLEGKFVVPTLPYDCKRLMVAPNPWNRDVICHPFAMDKSFVVINPRLGRWEFVKVFAETARVKAELFSNYASYWNGLVFVELSPWSSPFYAKAKRRSSK